MPILTCCPCGGRRKPGGRCNRCGETTRPARQAYEAKRQSSTERGYDGQWRKASEQYRQGRLCVCCEAKGIVRLAEVTDHVTPHRGNARLFWDVNNWQALCRKCHDRDKAAIEARYQGRERLIEAAWRRYLAEQAAMAVQVHRNETPPARTAEMAGDPPGGVPNWQRG